MPLAPGPVYQTPDFWAVFGHSYMQYAFGHVHPERPGRRTVLRGHGHRTREQTELGRQRIAGMYRGLLHRRIRPVLQGIEEASARWSVHLGRRGPHCSAGEINDLGLAGFTTQFKTAYQHAMRTVISRWPHGSDLRERFPDRHEDVLRSRVRIRRGRGIHLERHRALVHLDQADTDDFSVVVGGKGQGEVRVRGRGAPMRGVVRGVSHGRDGSRTLLRRTSSCRSGNRSRRSLAMRQRLITVRHGVLVRRLELGW